MVSTWTGAFGGEVNGEPRAICIAGTGVGCWGKNAGGEIAQTDGVGPLLGDRGSGYWIGENALRHAARAFDSVIDVDDLSRAVMAHFGVSDIKALIRIVYAPDFERARVAELARVVLANENVAAAADILARAGQELAATSLAVLTKLSGGEVCGEVALIGGVLAHAAPVRVAFVEKLAQSSTSIAFVEARYEPAVGAALLLPGNYSAPCASEYNSRQHGAKSACADFKQMFLSHNSSPRRRTWPHVCREFIRWHRALSSSPYAIGCGRNCKTRVERGFMFNLSTLVSLRGAFIFVKPRFHV